MSRHPASVPVAAEVRQDQDSEAAIIRQIKESISTNNWNIGRLAALWTTAWARGRGDGDLGGMVGMSGDQVGQRRRVWERFGGKTDTYQFLSWSHFYAALNWDDAESYLQWASDNQATVSELKAYRQAKVAPPLFSDADPFGEGEEGAGTDSGGDGQDAEGEEDGTETGGTESEEQPPRPPRSGKDEPGGAAEKPKKTQKELFAEQKAKAVKTAEAMIRAIDDLTELRKVSELESTRKSLCKAIETLKSCK